MNRKAVLLRLGVLFAGFSSAKAFYNENTIRCQLFGINYNDCLGSIYRPSSAYDSYIKSFKLPIRKDDSCAFSICKVALLGTGSDRFISVAQNAHPPGECLCLGSNSCGCEAVSVSAPDVNTVFALPAYQVHQPEQKVVTKIINKTKTVTVKVTEHPDEYSDQVAVERIPIRRAERITASTNIGSPQNDLLTELAKKLDELNSKTPLHNFMAAQPPQTASLAASASSHPIHIQDFHANGNVITIPYSTVTTTVNVTVPQYSTTVRTQYVVNTVDNYLTETVTKTQLKTTTKIQKETTTKTVTETISDHVERTKFSTVYIPKTVTVDKISTLTKYSPKTITVTTTKKIYATRKTPSGHLRKKIQQSPPTVNQKGSGIISNGIGPSRKYFMVKPQITQKLVCKMGCTNPSIPLSGECPVSSMGICPPAQIQAQPGFSTVPQINQANMECRDANCTEMIKTVYVRASASPVPNYTPEALH